MGRRGWRIRGRTVPGPCERVQYEIVDFGDPGHPFSEASCARPLEKSEHGVEGVADPDVLEVPMVAGYHQKGVGGEEFEYPTEKSIHALESGDSTGHPFPVAGVVGSVVGEEGQIEILRDVAQVVSRLTGRHLRELVIAEPDPPRGVHDFAGEGPALAQGRRLSGEKPRSRGGERGGRRAARPPGPMELLWIRVGEGTSVALRLGRAQDVLLRHERAQADWNPRSEMASVENRSVFAGEQRRLPRAALRKTLYAQQAIQGECGTLPVKRIRALEVGDLPVQKVVEGGEVGAKEGIRLWIPGTDSDAVEEDEEDASHASGYRWLGDSSPGGRGFPVHCALTLQGEGLS